MQHVLERLDAFVAVRDWRQFHSPKNLASSIVIEAGELLEHFQWTNPSFTELSDREAVAEEVADVFIYCLLFFKYLGVDIERTVAKKIAKNEIKHPVDANI
jgi:NTP pyrophosphatase (non-canonical NTP hydrolase)